MSNICVHCEKEIPYHRARRHAKFCSDKCYKEFQHKIYKENKNCCDNEKISKGNTGALQELLVSADLFRKGYNVFRSLSPSCPCDLVAFKNERQILMIEVTTGYRNADGKISCSPKKQTYKYDILAIVVHSGEIEYRPPLF